MQAVLSALYSGQPAERVAAFKDVSPIIQEEILSRIPRWPVKSPGSLNAWVVFLGPSPGSSPSSLQWNFDPRPSIGKPHPGVSEYLDTKGYWEGIREFARTIFPELTPNDAYSATMVRNLVTDESSTAPTGQRMHLGAREAVEVLGQAIRPRLIVAMGGVRAYSDRAFRNVAGIAEHERGVLLTARKRLEKKWFSLKGYWPSGEPFLYTSVVGIHPSLAHVSRGDSLEFLRERSDVARSL